MNSKTTLTTLFLFATLGAGLVGCESPQKSSNGADKQPVGEDTVSDQDRDGFTVEQGDCDDADPRWQPIERDRFVERRTLQNQGEEASLYSETISHYDVDGNLVEKRDARPYTFAIMGHSIAADTVQDETFSYTSSGQVATQKGEMRLEAELHGLAEGHVVGEINNHWNYDVDGTLELEFIRERIGAAGFVVKDHTETREYESGRLVAVEMDWDEEGVHGRDGFSRLYSQVLYTYDQNGDLSLVDDQQVRYWDNSASSAPTSVVTEYKRNQEGLVLEMAKVVDFHKDGSMDSRFDEQYLDAFKYNENGDVVEESYWYKDHWEEVSKEQTKSYNEEGQLVRKEFNDGIESFIFHYEYDETGRLVREIVEFFDGDQETFTYTYDEAGRLLAKTGTLSDGFVFTEQLYTYDAEGRLLTETLKNEGNVAHELRNTYHEDGSLLERVREARGQVVTDTFEMTYACQ